MEEMIQATKTTLEYYSEDDLEKEIKKAVDGRDLDRADEIWQELIDRWQKAEAKAARLMLSVAAASKRVMEAGSKRDN